MLAAVMIAVVASGCARHARPAVAPAAITPPAYTTLLPQPAIVEPGTGDGFAITPATPIVLDMDDPAAARVAHLLAVFVGRATGTPLSIVRARGTAPPIELSYAADSLLGPEGYDLSIAPGQMRLMADSAAGLFYGVQTIRQLLPYWDEYQAVAFRQLRPLTLPPVHIGDRPRYAWRGAMLDVSRHFFGVADVEHYIDLLALLKMNRLHLHLADDQGWRLEIKSWPNLTAIGGATEVGGGAGGFYTQAQFADLVRYAADRFITIVPEFDMPGHINAAMASYAELNCDGTVKPPYTKTGTGVSWLCVDKDLTYTFLDQVIGEVAALTPGSYFHVGGDEVRTLTPDQYKAFIARVQQIVAAHGKTMIGWDEIASTPLAPTTIVQHWRPEAPRAELAQAPHLILSPGDHAYLDMKYDAETALGLNWAGLTPVRRAYDWDPAAIAPSVAPGTVLGLEAPLWSETVATMMDVEFLAMPRLALIADLAWAPAASHDWARARLRLAAQASRWTAIGLNFYRAPEIPWTTGHQGGGAR